MFKNKKGAELSLNIVIISIIVIVVLVVVIAFFLGAFGSLKRGFEGAKPDDLDLARQTCTSNCQFAQSFDSDSLKSGSSYCTRTIRVDRDQDGKADIKAHCYSGIIGVSCPGISDRNLCRASPEEPL